MASEVARGTTQVDDVLSPTAHAPAIHPPTAQVLATHTPTAHVLATVHNCTLHTRRGGHSEGGDLETNGGASGGDAHMDKDLRVGDDDPIAVLLAQYQVALRSTLRIL